MYDKRLCIFIDYSNLQGGASRYGEEAHDPEYEIDIFKLIRKLSRGHDLLRTYFYCSTAQPQDVRSKTEQYWHQKTLQLQSELVRHGKKASMSPPSRIS